MWYKKHTFWLVSITQNYTLNVYIYSRSVLWKCLRFYFIFLSNYGIRNITLHGNKTVTTCQTPAARWRQSPVTRIRGRHVRHPNAARMPRPSTDTTTYNSHISLYTYDDTNQTRVFVTYSSALDGAANTLTSWPPGRRNVHSAWSSTAFTTRTKIVSPTDVLTLPGNSWPARTSARVR